MNKSFTYKLAATLATVAVLASTSAFGTVPPAHKVLPAQSRPAAVNFSRAAIHHHLIAAEASERLSRIAIALRRAHSSYHYDTGALMAAE